MLKIKWTIVLLFCTAVFLSAQHENSPVTIQSSSIRLSKIFKQITKQTGLEFSYNSRLLKTKELVSIDLELAPLDQVLRELQQITNLQYKVIEDQIVLQSLPVSRELSSDKKFTLSGFIADKATGENLTGATIYLKGTNVGTVSNEFGYYSIPVTAGEHTLSISYIGYGLKEKKLEINSTISVNLTLSTIEIELPDVLVGIPIQAKLDQKEIGKMQLNAKALANIPEFGGESGLVKGLQSLPGIKTHSDGSAFFYVRGGEKDQNLIIIDDAPIYNPSHLFGFYSIVVPEFTKSIQVFKSDVPTYLGDRLSSIVNIRTKDGNLNKWSFSGAINPLMNRFALEIPVVKEKAAVFLSFRRSNFDWIYKERQPNSDIGFGDFNFKYNHKLNNKNRVFLTVIGSNDRLENTAEAFGRNSGIAWGNFAATFRWNHIFGPKLFSNTTFYTGNYVYRLSLGQNNWDSGIGSLSMKTDFTHYANEKFKSRFGLEFQTIYTNPGIISNGENPNFFPQLRSNFSRKRLLYYQANLEIDSKTALNLGLRIPTWESIGPETYFTFDENYAVEDTVRVLTKKPYNTFINFDPRVSLRRTLDKSSFIKFSLGSYHQYLQIISNSSSPFSALEIWLPAGPNIQPQQAWQAATNYLKYFEGSGLELSAAVYYKIMNNQIDYPEQPEILLNRFREGELRFGEMRSYGLELMLKKESGKLNGWLNYNLSKTIRETAEVNNGNPYPAFQDRPHDFSMLLNYQLSKRFILSTYWTSYTGSPFSSPVGFYEFNNSTVPLFGEKNNDRLPDYHRLDVGFKWKLNKSTSAKYQHNISFSIYNFLAHKNVLSINFNKIDQPKGRPVVPLNETSDDPLITSQTDLIRFFPSLTYNFKIQ